MPPQCPGMSESWRDLAKLLWLPVIFSLFCWSMIVAGFYLGFWFVP